MGDIREVERQDVLLKGEFISSRKTLSSATRARIRAHIEKVKGELNARIDEISSLADSPSDWKSKNETLLPKLKNERSKLVNILSEWEDAGF